MRLTRSLLVLLVAVVLYENVIAKASSSGQIDDDPPQVCATAGTENFPNDVCRDVNNDKDCLNVDCNTETGLLYCRCTCRVCVPLVNDHYYQQDLLVEPNIAWGQIDKGVSLDILRLVRDTNRIYFLPLIQPDDRYRLCRDHSDMCAFYALQGQCQHATYRTYLERECPLSCRFCQHTLWQSRSFIKFLQDLGQIYNEGLNAQERRRQSLTYLLKSLGFDPDTVLREDSIVLAGNWPLEVHRRLMAIIPPLLANLYPLDVESVETGMPWPLVSDEHLQVLAALHGLDFDQLETSTWTTEEKARRGLLLYHMFVPYRSRGFVVRIMQDLDEWATRPLQLAAGFAIPNDGALRLLKQEQSILQVGAGSGYWAAVLRHNGIQVWAYDLNLPHLGSNMFFDHAYVDDIQEASCVDLFSSKTSMTWFTPDGKIPSLLLVWPNDPDPIDNAHFCFGDGCAGSQAVWDAECLEAFLQVGGERVIFVGEREAVLSQELQDIVGGPDCGLSATRRFQRLLVEQFELRETVSLPNWWLNNDDLTVWERRRS